MNENIIEVRNVSKHFNNHQVLNDINLQIQNGEFLTLLGPSGCGKTTLLRLLAGFEEPDQGSIWLQNKEITTTPPEIRHVNMVFQSYALFPHMTVYENVAFGLRCQKMSHDIIKQKVTEALAVVKLANFAERKPQQLSGGQQQRVAIARAVVNQPVVLLLDEPFSALDYSLRKNMRIELKELQRRLGITFIFVTHDQEEALSMSDRIVVMNQGRIEQMGSPRDVYEEPKNLFVAGFVGEANIFETKIEKSSPSEVEVLIEGQIFRCQNKKDLKTDQEVHVMLRPEDIRVWDQREIEDTSDMLPGSVEQVIYKGSTVDLIVRLKSNKLISASEFFDEDDEKLEYDVGEKVWVHWTSGWEVIIPHE
ncbi:MAG: spermidine/putrescine ABC transporter ATP-binding protein PotA [Gammaproteobacteria bacterium]|nr:spermidine/putrescine ABC transporter ATP-binding protein PotA [Gammaproteobacteria bacterium]